MIDVTKISKALSDPIRYRIMLMLARRDESVCCLPECRERPEGMCNCEIMSGLGLIQSRVSYHMKELTDAGLVDEIPSGKWKYYTINHNVLQQFIDQINRDLAGK